MKQSWVRLFNCQGMSKMEIKEIQICGFKNVTKIDLTFDKIIALVGNNGYGKSNVIDAIDFAFDFIHGESKIKTGMMSYKPAMPILKANKGKDFSFQISLRLEEKDRAFIVEYSFAFSWQTKNSTASIKSETLRIKEDSKNQRFNSYITRNESSAFYRTSETGRCAKSISIDNNALVLNKLLAMDDLFYLNIIKEINNIQFFIERHLDASPSFQPDPFVIRGLQELELQGIQSIPRAIFYLQKDYPNQYELLINAFKQLFPQVISINVREIKLNHSEDVKISEDAPFLFTDSIYSMEILDDTLIQPIGFEHLSDGTKRIFLMLTIAIIADIKNLPLIAIEEPENSIHPSLFQKYLIILNQLIDNCKIIMTSHSPYIIQYLDPCSIYIGFEKESREVDFKRISSSKVKNLLKDSAEYDKSVGDYIFNLLSTSDAKESLMEYVKNNE